MAAASLKPRRRGLLVLVTILLVLGGLTYWLAGYRGTVPPAPPHARVRPNLAGLSPVTVCWIETGRFDGFTASGLLIRHPRGHLLLDAGNSSFFSSEVSGYGFFNHWRLELFPGMLTPSRPIGEVLRALGEDPARLRYLVPSHVHVDHIGGMMDLPRIPVLLPAEEKAFVERVGGTGSVQVVPAHARALEDGRMQPMRFEPRPYETFDESYDLFGDGAVVFVKLGGHTPGSVGTFVNVTPERRIFHVGDAVNDFASLDRRAGKPLFQRQWNHDDAAANGTLAKLAQLREMGPEIRFLPAHDRAAWLGLFGQPGCPPAAGP